jgi:Zn-dependent protease with chaperone function
MAFEADYFDGRSSARRRVNVEPAGDSLRVVGEGVALEVKLAELRFQPRMGRLPQRISLPGDGLLVADPDAVAGALTVPASTSRIHGLESDWLFVLGALVAVVVALFLGWRYGVPAAARSIAHSLPVEVEAELAADGLAAMDRYLFHPTSLTLEQRARMEAVFREMLRQAESPPAVRLEFRDGGFIGANALAMPGGIVVVTDQLVKLMAGDDEVMAVLAHEVGHVRHRHVTRSLLQSSITAIASTLLLGDVSAVAGLAATAPTILLHNTYSRDHEREADAFGFDLMRRTGRSPQLLGVALARLEREARGKDADGREIPGYLASHPPTEERLQAAVAASR